MYLPTLATIHIFRTVELILLNTKIKLLIVYTPLEKVMYKYKLLAQ